MKNRVLAYRSALARQGGFTLIEVMIVVAIVAILASIALPAYGDYVRRGQLPEAFAGMADLRVKLEQYYQDRRSYGVAQCADGADTAPPSPPSWYAGGSALTYAGSVPGRALFTFNCVLTAGGQGYQIDAVGARERAIGHTFTITHANQRTTTAFPGHSSTSQCWLSRGSEC
jgi:type IV pilus assembly protein PilE